MRRPLVLLVIAACLASSLPSAVVHAAPPPKVADALTGDAKSAFNEGRLLFAKQDFAAARERFRRAYDLSKDVRVLYNVAVCFKEEGKYAAAIRVLEEGAGGTPAPPPDHVQRVADTVETLMALVAMVTVDGITPNMTVEVDGEVVPVGPPGRFLVDAGTRSIVVRAPGFAPQSFTRDFPASERYAFRVALNLLPGKVRVTASGARDASVLLDGRDVGLAPLELKVSPGPHEVVVRAPGFRSVRKTLDVTSDAESVLDATLERDGRTAHLRVSAGSGDTISVDGGPSVLGAFDAWVPAGEHRLTISRPDAEPQTIEIALREDEVRDMRITLEKKKSGVPAWLWIVGGALAVGGASTAIYFAARPTEFEGSTPGTLNPRIVPASALPAVGGFR
ncbi:MAG: PEGA domain-containing protein [Deltaproteobacteria bacterium]|nr:PEGA domain-containing protein [Deltaproteobacteria bacterium]